MARVVVKNIQYFRDFLSILKSNPQIAVFYWWQSVLFSPQKYLLILNRYKRGNNMKIPFLSPCPSDKTETCSLQYEIAKYPGSCFVKSSQKLWGIFEISQTGGLSLQRKSSRIFWRENWLEFLGSRPAVEIEECCHQKSTFVGGAI